MYVHLHLHVHLEAFQCQADMSSVWCAMQDVAGHSVKSQNLTVTGKADRIERDAGHSASSSGIDAQGAVAVPDFTPLRNGSGCVHISLVLWVNGFTHCLKFLLLYPPAISLQQAVET